MNPIRSTPVPLLLSLLSWIFLLGLIFGCVPPAPIRIGFAAELSGKQSEPGMHLRNGVQMAVEELNAAGGIAGRRIELQVEDDLGTPEGATAAETHLADAGVVAVVGHYTSNQTLEGMAVAQQRGIPLISGTASASVLSGKKDLFFRTIVDSDFMGRVFARYIRQRRGLAQAAIVYDLDNNTYAEPMVKSFTEIFQALGGSITNQVSFSAAATTDVTPLVNALRAARPDGLLIIASPANTAIISQAVRLNQWDVALFSSSWGQGDALIQNGGSAVEGMEIIIAIDINDPSEKLQTFKSNYQKKFNRAPIFTAVEGYETMLLLAAALKSTAGEAKGLPAALTQLSNFQGLSGPVQLDAYGDAVRPIFIQQVRNRAFITIGKADLLQ